MIRRGLLVFALVAMLAACGGDDDAATGGELPEFELEYTRERQAELGLDSGAMERQNESLEEATNELLADADLDAICDDPALLTAIIDLADMEPPLSDWLETDIDRYLNETC